MNRLPFSRILILSAAIGAILAAILFYITNPTGFIFSNLWLGSNLLNYIIVGGIAGAILGTAFNFINSSSSNLFPSRKPEVGVNLTISDQLADDYHAKLRLHEELLDIYKEKVKTGDVQAYKEIIRETKTIEVPVQREELVIKTNMTEEFINKANQKIPEIIRIPLWEEQIDISKHRVELNDVSLYQQEYQETTSVKEKLRKEQIRIETIGHPKITEEDHS